MSDGPPPILAFGSWKNNAELIQDCALIGYLQDDWKTLDPTYGLGSFYKLWRPKELIGSDLDVSKSPVGFSVDFRYLPWGCEEFQAVVLDPPYKLNGTERGGAEDRYGVNERVRWQDRMELIRVGIRECARVLTPGGFLLLRCQDQVCSGRVVWQTDDFTAVAASVGLSKVDRFDFTSYRPQPSGRRQIHARRNTSQLLVFQKRRVR